MTEPIPFILKLSLPLKQWCRFIKGEKPLLPLMLLVGFFPMLQLEAQNKLKGQVITEQDREGIHVINLNYSKFSITDEEGKFEIPVRTGDTLTFSSISHKTKELVVTSTLQEEGEVVVHLDEAVNVLEEVVVGKVLSGDLTADLASVPKGETFNFYNVGIPGATKLPPTQSQRRLNEATTGSGLIPLNPLINAITGRTKRLKHLVHLEKMDDCLFYIKNLFGTDLQEQLGLEEDQVMTFLYFCQDSPHFKDLCARKRPFEIWEFLDQKLLEFSEQRQEAVKKQE